MGKPTDKTARILCINEYLKEGKDINLQLLADRFNVSKRTIQRDIADIKTYYADEIVRDGEYKNVHYDVQAKSYRLSK